jgi:hypothetical protein
MWRGAAAVMALIALSGCGGGGQWPKTAEEFRALDSPFLDRKSYAVQRSLADANASLRTATQKCLNGTQRSTSTLPAPFGGYTTESRVTLYSSTFNVVGGRGELTARKNYPPHSGVIGFPKDGAIFYVVSTAAQGSGTALTIHRSKLAGSDLDAAVQEWASGGPIRCPQLPG